MILRSCCCAANCCEIQPIAEANVGFPEGVGISATPKSSTILAGTMCKVSGRCYDYEWTAESCWGGTAMRGRSSIVDYYGFRDVATYNCYSCNSGYSAFCEMGASCTDMAINSFCDIKCGATGSGTGCPGDPCVLTPATTQSVSILGPCCDFCSPAASGLTCTCAQNCSTTYSSWSGSISVPIEDDPTGPCLDAIRCKFSPSEEHQGDMSINYDVLSEVSTPATYNGTSSFTTFTFSRNAVEDSIDHCGPNQAGCGANYINVSVAPKGEICSNANLEELNDPCTNVCDCTLFDSVNNCICSSGKITLTIYERGERISSRQLTPGNLYCIVSVGTTDFRCYGAATNTVGTIFTAIACTSGGAYPALCTTVCDPVSGLTLYGDAVELFPHTFTVKGRGPSAALTQKFRDNFTNGVFQYTKNITWDGVTNVSVAATAIVTGESYQIQTLGTTDFTLIGAPENVVGYCFTATAAGTGTGTASLNGVRRANTLITGYTITDVASSWFGGTQFVPAASTWQPVHSDPDAKQVSLCPCNDICVDRLYNLWFASPTYATPSNPRDCKAIPAHYARVVSNAYYNNNSIVGDYSIGDQIDFTSISESSNCPICNYEQGIVCANPTQSLCVDSGIDFGGGYSATGDIISSWCAITPGVTGPVMVAFWNSNFTINTGIKFDWVIYLP